MANERNPAAAPDAASPAIAVVGAGLIGRSHARLLARAGRLAAVVDPAPGAADFAAGLGVPHRADLRDLPAGTEGVVLATPTQLHVEQGLDCIRRGLPVLIEKPLAADSAGALALAEAAEAAGVAVLVGHHRRHNPRVAAARAAIEAGMLGQVVAVQASVLLCKPDGYFEPEWRRRPGAGPILTNLIHEVDMLRHLLGEVTAVQAMTSHAVRGFAVEDGAAVILRFASGALGTIVISDAAAAPWSWELTAAENPAYPATGQGCMTISGTHGALEIPTLMLWTHDGARDWHAPIAARRLPFEDADPLARQLDHFADVIRGRAEPLVDARDGAASVAVVEAVARGGTGAQPEGTAP